MSTPLFPLALIGFAAILLLAIAATEAGMKFSFFVGVDGSGGGGGDAGAGFGGDGCGGGGE